MFCESCGKQIWEEDSVCPHCNSPISNSGVVGAAKASLKGILGKWDGSGGTEPPSESATSPTSKTMGSIVLAAGEFIVRKYHITQILWPRCSGHLFVTNRRLLFHAFRNGIFSNSRTVLEVPLDSISLNSAYFRH